jgi:hypothetical protein
MSSSSFAENVIGGIVGTAIWVVGGALIKTSRDKRKRQAAGLEAFNTLVKMSLSESLPTEQRQDLVLNFQMTLQAWRAGLYEAYFNALFSAMGLFVYSALSLAGVKSWFAEIAVWFYAVLLICNAFTINDWQKMINGLEQAFRDGFQKRATQTAQVKQSEPKRETTPALNAPAKDAQPRPA